MLLIYFVGIKAQKSKETEDAKSSRLPEQATHLRLYTI